MRATVQDFRYAVRQLRRNPSFTLLVVLTIGLGIGANTAIFSMLNGYLRPLAVPAPEQIVFIAARTKGDETGFRYRMSYSALEDLRQEADRFSDVFGFNTLLLGLGADGKVTQFLNSAVTGNYFSALGVKPAAGRLFVPGEGEKPGENLTLVLGYSCWQKRFGGSASVIGKQVRLNGKAATIVGVVPKTFHGLYAGAEMDGYVPLSGHTVFSTWDFSSFLTDRARRPLTVLGRLKPGVTLAQAQSSVDVLAKRLAARHPATDTDIGMRLVPETLGRPMPMRFMADRIPAIRALLLVLAALVLLLACMNVANLLIVRATTRQREMAIRAALGSGRVRLVRQMLTESALLAVLGGIAGMLFGKWGSVMFASSIDLATDFPITLDFSFDWPVFLYALAATVATGIGIGLWPALRTSRTEAGAVLHDGMRVDSSGGGRQRVRGILVVSQVAGSLVLLIVAGHFARSLQKAQRIDLGFDPDNLLNARMDPLFVGYDRGKTNEFFRELLRRVRALPGVQSATLAFTVPMSYISDGFAVYVEGRPVVPGEQPALVGYNTIDLDYFQTLRIPIVRGRAFHDFDNESSPPVAVINETMARRFWPDKDPIGQRFSNKPGGPLLQVVGVARNSKYLAVFESNLPYAYVPSAQWFSHMRVLQVRTSVAPESLRDRVRQEVRVLDAEMPVADLQTMRQALVGGLTYNLFRVGAQQAGAMGILGLILSVIGVYGVVSYGAAQRTREIGIRIALGAEPRDVRGLVLGQGMVLVVAGVIAGLAGAAALSRVAAKYMLLSGTVDSLTFAGITLVLVAIALLACYLPARRAMRTDPMVALRHE
jgi:putative ABC transport system permease protein